jgi:hypothetical protein
MLIDYYKFIAQPPLRGRPLWAHKIILEHFFEDFHTIDVPREVDNGSRCLIFCAKVPKTVFKSAGSCQAIMYICNNCNI